MNSSKFKLEFLRSGIPLEVSVVQIITALGIEDFGEVEYERDGKYFTTDIHAYSQHEICKSMGVVVNFVIECKYNTKDHKWVFMKFLGEDNTPTHYRDYTSNIVFDMFLGPQIKDWNYNSKYTSHLDSARTDSFFDCDEANKGVVIHSKGSNPKIIPEAVSQVLFGSIKAHWVSINYNLEMLGFYGDEPLDFEDDEIQQIFPIASITLPIIVTTSKLYLIKKNTTLGDIEKSDDIMELCEEKDGVVLLNKGHSPATDYSKSLYKNQPLPFQEEEINWIRNFRLNKNFDPIKIGETIPERIYIVNYDAVENQFSNCLNNIRKLCSDLKR